MDIAAIRSLSGLGRVESISEGTLKSTDLNSLKTEKADGTMFDAF